MLLASKYLLEEAEKEENSKIVVDREHFLKNQF